MVGALIGDGRSRQRLVFAGVVTAWFLARLPWWGITWVAEDYPARWFGRSIQNADTVGALLALALLALSLRPAATPAPSPSPAPAATASPAPAPPT